jgi:voltage-gated potassium channel
MESALSFYSIYMILIFFYCSLAFYKFESVVNHGIKTYADAVWMTFTTISTIGYGDVYPATLEGRFIAVILVISGAGFFALLSGEFATILIKASQNNERKLMD